MSRGKAAHVAWPLGCTLGEGALWCERRGRLIFTDIENRVLHAWRPADANSGSMTQSWPMPDRVGSMALCASDPDNLLLALAGGVMLFDLATRTPLSPLLPIEADEPRTRLNDGRCDPQGRFVVGTYNQAPGEDAIGHWYRIDGRSGALQLERLPLPQVGVANACCFSPDGSRMFFTDSPTRTIWSVNYPAHGVPGKPEVFARIDDDDGYPDGACVDVAGGVWVALWDGAALQRFDAAGRPSLHIELPARRPTCPAFGGAALDHVYVTSARAPHAVGLTEDVEAQGALLVIGPQTLGAWRGRAEHRFVDSYQ